MSMTSWIFGLIGVALAGGVWGIVRGGGKRERRQALQQWRRDRTGRATLGTFDKSLGGPDTIPFERERLVPTSGEHASTLPFSFSNSGGWSTGDTCSPPGPDIPTDTPADSRPPASRD